jgi:hypothetical protein
MKAYDLDEMTLRCPRWLRVRRRSNSESASATGLITLREVGCEPVATSPKLPQSGGPPTGGETCST